MTGMLCSLQLQHPPTSSSCHVALTKLTASHVICRRVLTDAVLLPNGHIAVVNGAQKGVPGGANDGGGVAKDPAYTAIVYKPDGRPGNRITTLASSTIHRWGGLGCSTGCGMCTCENHIIS